MKETKIFKSVNDFIIGAALALLGVYILITEHVVESAFKSEEGGILVRPDVYVRLIGGCLVFFSIVLILKSIKYTKSEQVKPFTFIMTREVAMTLAALVLYTFLLPVIHFFPATFLVIFFLTWLYARKERSSQSGDKPDGKVFIRRFLVYAVFSIILVVAVYLVFEKVLLVALP
jgi:hypothetical protein